MIANDADAYLKEVLEKYEVNGADAHSILDKMKTLLAPWANGYCEDMVMSGSFSHGTAIKRENDKDVDTVLYMRSDTPFSPQEMVESLTKYLRSKKYKVEVRNISVRIKYNNSAVDFVVGKKIPGRKDYYKVWSNTENKELETNIEIHKKLIKNSGFRNEIKLIKCWSMLNKLGFDGFFLSLTVLEALKDSTPGDLANNFLTVLKYLTTKWEYKRFVDPSRETDRVDQNNTPEEKKKIIKAAKKALKEDTWNNVVY